MGAYKLPVIPENGVSIPLTKKYKKGTKIGSLNLLGGLTYGGFHKWGITIAGWFIIENPT